MASDLATLSITVDANQAKRELSGLESAFGKLKGAAAALGATLSAGLLFKKFIDETSAAQHATAQLEARIKSTGGAAGQSMGALTAYASEMQRLTTFSDEAVMSAQAMLLTFTRIKGDVFPQATKAVADLATAMGGDMKGAAIQVGKALNDPVQGITALTRVGVSFTKEQKAVIESLVDTGRTADAQRLILRELETEFGGAAEAARNTLGGALTGLKNAWGELFEASRESSQGIIDAINGLILFLPRLRDAFNAVFGGIRLLYVDVVSHIQQGNAAMYRDTAKVLSLLGGALALVPGMSSAAGTLIAKAQALRTEADTLSTAFDAWKKEQTALITGTQQLGQALTVTTSAGELATKTALDGAVADLRAARAKAELTAAAERELAIEDERARRAKLGPAGVIGGFASAAGRSEAGNVTAARAEIERFGAYTVAVDKRTSDQILADRTQMRARDFEAHLQNEARKHQATIKTQDDEKAIRDNFMRQWQQTVANGIASMLQNGLTSWKDFFSSVAAFGAQTMGDLVSRWVASLSAVKQGYAQIGIAGAGQGYQAGYSIGGNKGVAAGALSGAASGAAIGSIVPGIGTAIGAAVGGLAGLVGGLFGAGAQAKEAAKQNALLAEEYRKTALAAARAAEAARAALAFSEALAESDLQVQKLRLAGLDAEADALALWNRQVEQFGDAVRKGFSEDYLRRLSEFFEAQRKMAEESRAQTDALNAQRAATEAATQAARDLADAQQKAADAERDRVTELAEMHARAAERTMRFADATEALGVRLLRAQGQTEEADRRAFAAAQLRERREAEMAVAQAKRDALAEQRAEFSALQAWIKDSGIPNLRLGGTPASVAAAAQGYFGGMAGKNLNDIDENYESRMNQFFGASVPTYYRAEFETMLARLMSAGGVGDAEKYLKDLLVVQDAEKGGGSRPGASAGTAGTAGSFHSIVSRATADQGDRMVDLLTSSRILLAAIEENTRPLRAGLGRLVNTALGSELQGSQTLSGSAWVT